MVKALRENIRGENMTAKELAKAITAMRYGELLSIAIDFAEMCEDEEIRAPPKTREDFANLLWEWAESQN